jgi:hypothetical protein
MSIVQIKELLDCKSDYYNCLDFIASDPISVPHLFERKEDIEIAGFLTAVLSWGQRKTIINKVRELISLMDFSPYDFILHSRENDLKIFEKF